MPSPGASRFRAAACSVPPLLRMQQRRVDRLLAAQQRPVLRSQKSLPRTARSRSQSQVNEHRTAGANKHASSPPVTQPLWAPNGRFPLDRQRTHGERRPGWSGLRASVRGDALRDARGPGRAARMLWLHHGDHHSACTEAGAHRHRRGATRALTIKQLDCPTTTARTTLPYARAERAAACARVVRPLGRGQ